MSGTPSSLLLPPRLRGVVVSFSRLKREEGIAAKRIALVLVKVRSFLTMEEIIGEGDVSLRAEDSTVDGLLQELSRRHGEPFTWRIFSPKTGKVISYWIVVNGRHCKDTSLPLNDGDEVILYPAWAGG